MQQKLKNLPKVVCFFFFGRGGDGETFQMSVSREVDIFAISIQHLIVFRS